jgi:hypothetical protein
MRLSTASLLTVAVAPIAVSAAPFRRSIDNGTATVLQFANVLEGLESNFYAQALGKFQPSDFTNAGFASSSIPIQQFTNIASDEAIHFGTLQAVLTDFGQQPINCSYDFSSVLTSVSAMTPVARAVEFVGVGAYLGAAPLIGDPIVLAAAGSIVTNEGRHQTILNLMNGATSVPQAFDIPMLPQEVLAIAGAFITGPCDLGITPNVPLSITNTGNVTTGTQLQFSSPALNASTDSTNFNCQMLTGGAPFTISQPLNNCIVPQGINGPVLIWITPDNQPLPNNLQDRQTQQVVAGPAVTFIDTVGDELGQMIRPNNGAVAPPPTTVTLSPAQASSLVPAPSSPPAADPNNASNSNGTSSGTGVIVNGVSLIPAPTPSSS